MAEPNFRKLIKKAGLYPPCPGMGIRLKSVSDDYTRFALLRRQRWHNRKLFGAQFWGCLFSVCDLLNESGQDAARINKEVCVRTRNRT